MDLTRPEWWTDGAASDLQRIAYIARSADCEGMDAAGVADYINLPQVVETRYRDATAAEFWNAMDDASKLLLLELVKQDDAGARLLWANLQVGGVVAVDPDRMSETVATLAGKAQPQSKAAWDVADTGISATVGGGVKPPSGEPPKAATFLETLQALCAQETTICIVHAPLEEGGMAWLDPAAAVTAAFVAEALGG